MELQTRPAFTISSKADGPASFPFPVNAKFIGKPSVAANIICKSLGLGVHVVAFVPALGPVPPPIIVVVPAASASVTCLRADEVDVSVDRAGRDDKLLSRDDFRARADDEIRGDAFHDVWIASFANSMD